MAPGAKIARRRGATDTSIEFRDAADTRRCTHCFAGRRHTVDAHASAVRFYDDDGSPL